jgi:hypothetical protein
MGGSDGVFHDDNDLETGNVERAAAADPQGHTRQMDGVRTARLPVACTGDPGQGFEEPYPSLPWKLGMMAKIEFGAGQGVPVDAQ